MKISYYRRRKIKTRKIALQDFILEGIESPNDLSKITKDLNTSSSTVLSV